MKLTASVVPYSSVVGSSIKLQDEAGQVIALLIVSIPNPELDYKSTAKLVTDALVSAQAEAGRLRDLLRRYIRHVGNSEGIDFISDNWIAPNGTSLWGRVKFTGDEVAELERLSEEGR